MVGTLKQSLLCVGIVLAVIVLQQPVGVAQQTTGVDVSQLRIPPGGAIAPASPTGEIEVWVTLADASLSEAAGRNGRRTAPQLSTDQQRAYARQLDTRQNALLAQIAALGGREIGRVRKAHNAIAVRIDASRLPEIAALPGVRAVRPVRTYSVDLSTTVPYIGAAAVQAAGIDGTGVKVAVLDSGIDYTHRNLGGPGTLAAYNAAYGAGTTDARNTTRDGLFPTAKVVDGIDFVGEVWPNGDLAPDEDPIDHAGHGTHVADIIAGHSLDNKHKGVAPGASLLAVKVCSAVSTSCSGVALLEGIDFALDPNGDDDLSDAVDVINMSLGSDYGMEEDDLTEASANAVRFGVVVVAAAGNAADRPYIVSSPSIGEGVISVAETAVPTAKAIPLVINAPANIARTDGNTATVDWAPVDHAVTGNVAYVGRGCPADPTTNTPADPYLADPAGKVALVDRGVCAVSLKVDRAVAAGATGVLIGLIAPGDAVSFSFGGGTHFAPTLVITQATATLIKNNIAAPVNVTISPANAITLTGSMQSTSARGPGMSHNEIKPDIGAPGASVSAVVGTGNGEEAFSGTSGATPMVSGSAALLLQANGNRTPTEVKALLMNTAETNIFINPATQPGVLAPITRIGAGEVRVNRAVRSTTAVWDDDTDAPSLSFGYDAVSHATEMNRRLVINNFGNKARTYGITASFRYANDAASGAVTLAVPGTVRVPAGGKKNFKVTLTIDPSKLPTWTLNGGSQGGNGALLQTVEFDGYLTIADGTDTVHVPWHVLPHKAAAVAPSTEKVKLVDGKGSVGLSNFGAVAGRVEVFALTGTSKKVPKKEFPTPGDNFAVVDLKAVGVRVVDLGGGNNALQFGIATNEARSHPNYPAEFDIYVDTNSDGEADYVIFNLENGGFGATGQNVVEVVNLATNTAVIRFFADADLDSSNLIATVLLSDLGVTPSAALNFSVYSFDNYFTGNLTDAIEGMRYTPSSPRYVATPGPSTTVPVNGSLTLNITTTGGAGASPSQTGFLLLYRDAAANQESSVIDVKGK